MQTSAPTDLPGGPACCLGGSRREIEVSVCLSCHPWPCVSKINRPLLCLPRKCASSAPRRGRDDATRAAPRGRTARGRRARTGGRDRLQAHEGEGAAPDARRARRQVRGLCGEGAIAPALPAAPPSAAAPPLPASRPPYAAVAAVATATAFASTSHLHHQRHEDHCHRTTLPPYHRTASAAAHAHAHAHTLMRSCARTHAPPGGLPAAVREGEGHALAAGRGIGSNPNPNPNPSLTLILSLTPTQTLALNIS